MGTRHMIGIISGGQYRVAQYGQWDGYVKGGQGESILKFLCTHDISVLKNKLDNCRFIDKDELLEVTPSSLRIRKKILDSRLRKRENLKNS